MTGSSGRNASFVSGAVVSNQHALIYTPTNYRGNGTKRGVVYLHSDGGLAWEPTIIPPMAAVATKYPIIGMDQGNTVQNQKTWGNRLSASNIDAAIAYLQGTLGAKPGKVFLCGYSMGGTDTLVYAAHNPEKVAGVWVTNAAIALTSLWMGGGAIQNDINAAYSTSTSPNNNADPVYPGTIQQNRDIWVMGVWYPSLFTSFPIILWTGANDGVALPTYIQNFADSVNAAGGNVTVRNDPLGDHYTPTYWACRRLFTGEAGIPQCVGGADIMSMFDAAN